VSTVEKQHEKDLLNQTLHARAEMGVNVCGRADTGPNREGLPNEPAADLEGRSKRRELGRADARDGQELGVTGAGEPAERPEAREQLRGER
jgi:hypothetical protein